jgi:hypothetical protein
MGGVRRSSRLRAVAAELGEGPAAELGEGPAAELGEGPAAELGEGPAAELGECSECSDDDAPDGTHTELGPGGDGNDVRSVGSAADDMSGAFARDLACHSVVHHWNSLATYTVCALNGQGIATPWPTTTSLCCWHCTEPFETQPIGIPVELRVTGTVVCDGNFCSYPCALAHIFTGQTTHREYFAKQLLCQVAREVHGVTKITPAPPTLMLQKYGGPYTIEQFRTTDKIHEVVVNPPFASQDVVFSATPEPDRAPQDPAAVAAGGAAAEEEGSQQHELHGLRVPAAPLKTEEFLSDSDPLGEAAFEKYAGSAASAEAQPPAVTGNLAGFVNVQS